MKHLLIFVLALPFLSGCVTFGERSDENKRQAEDRAKVERCNTMKGKDEPGCPGNHTPDIPPH